MSKKIPVYAWYFPNWHPDARNDKLHGNGWTEWQCVKNAVKRFENHQLYHPLWGYENEADPVVMEKKIDTAMKYGVDGFLWDFYWFDDEVGEGETKGSYRIKALNEGFFGAKNNEQFQIALMWCNHDSGYAHPAAYRNVARTQMPGDVKPETFFKMTEYLIKNYFWRKNYIRVDGKLYFILWDVRLFMKNMGGLHSAAVMLNDFRKRVREAGLGELCLSTAYRPWSDDAEFEKTLRALGIDSMCTYNWPMEPKTPERFEWPHFPYSDFVDTGIDTYRRSNTSMTLPVSITVTQGCDCSARTVASDMYEPIGYPFTWITENKNVADFERALRAAKSFFHSAESTGQFISISTWNEWTEGNFLEPSIEDGYASLEAVKRVFLDEE